MSADVGKTYRMLQEAHNLLRNGENVKVGNVETHYLEKCTQLEELDVQAILLLQPQAVIIVELADTNIPGSMEVTERVPDKILQLADEVVNIDWIADELITRLKERKIYDHSKFPQTLTIFFSQKNYYSCGNLP